MSHKAGDTRAKLRESRPAHGDSLSSLLVSLVLHLTLLVILAIVALPVSRRTAGGLVTTLTEAGTSNDEFDEPLEIVTDSIELDETEPADAPVSMAESPVVVDATDIFVEISNAPLSEITPLSSDIPGVQPGGANAAAAVPLSVQFVGRNEATRAALVRALGGSADSEEAVARGLAWLAAHQRYDGSWSLNHLTGECDPSCTHPGELANATVAATSMSLLCFLGAGFTHKDGEYATNVRQALLYLNGQVRATQAGADLRQLDQGNSGMYAHALATIALCEAFAMTKDPELRPLAQSAVNYVVAAQNPQSGGWRYAFRDTHPGDTSVVGWQIMALTSGRIGGLEFPQRTNAMAERFLVSVQDEKGAIYRYVPGRRRPEPSTTAVGLLCRMYLGWDHENPALERGVSQLSAIGPTSRDMYYNYYATQVMHHWGGEEWKQWNEPMRDWLVQTQERYGHAAGSWSPVNPDGSFRNEHGAMTGGRLYMTALALLTLEVYYRHLPLYQSRALLNDLALEELSTIDVGDVMLNPPPAGRVTQ